jgi:hypothetical protein
MRRALLQFYRLAVLVAVAWTIRAHAIRMRIEGNAPITIEEVRTIFPKAEEVRPDRSERAGMFVRDGAGHDLGYVLRSAPITDDIIGYRGWTDTLIAFDPALHVVGVRLRSSQDTDEHVGDIRSDRYFLKTWNGKSWDEVARRSPEEAGIEGVSGATMTSMAMAEGIMRRLRAADSALALPPPPIRFTWIDGGLVVIILAATVLAFVGTHGRAWVRRGFQIVVIAYVGFVAGSPLAQSLFAGWAQSGVPWRSAPALVLLMAAAVVVPWATRKPLYCHHICPHGAAQELLGRIAPRRWRLALPKDFAAGLRWLPPTLVAFVLIVTILGLPFDLAHLEPFDAYSLRAAGTATVALAIGGLVASLFVPMAYCRYGCPTGALLEFIRAHGRSDRFGRRDVAALLLVALAQVLAWKYQAIHAWLLSGT